MVIIKDSALPHGGTVLFMGLLLRPQRIGDVVVVFVVAVAVVTTTVMIDDDFLMVLWW